MRESARLGALHGNTGLRPDKASHLQFRDVIIQPGDEKGEPILLIEVRGNRGVGYCKSMPGAVLPFQRVMKRKAGKPSDLVFGKVQRELFNSILGELGLKLDRVGQPRTAYSLRHTYICLRHGRCRHLSGGKELPNKRRDDREALRCPYRQHPRRIGDQCATSLAAYGIPDVANVRSGWEVDVLRTKKTEVTSPILAVA